MIKLSDSKKVNQIYNQIKQIVLEKKEHSTYFYKSSQYLAERDVDKDIKKQYISEEGNVTYENSNGELVTIKFYRWHQYKRWSRYGIYEIPSFKAEIYIKDQLIWNLTSYCKDSFNGEYSNSQVSNLNIPFDILLEKAKKEIKKENIEDVPVNKEKEVIEDRRILFDEIDNLSIKYYDLERYKEALLLEKENKIEDAINEINNAYLIKLNDNDDNMCSVKNILSSFEKELEMYSTFNIDLIGIVLQELISIMECKDFVYKCSTNKYKIRVHGTNDSWDENKESNINIVVDKKYLKDSYEDIFNNQIIKDNFLLLDADTNNFMKRKNITFYKPEDGKIKSNLDYNNFSYVQIFIEELIQYRFRYKIINITEKELLQFLQNFVINNKDKIIKKYETNFDTKVLKLQLNKS